MHKFLTKQGYLLKKDEIDSKTVNQVIADLTIKPIVLKAYQDFVKPKSFEIYQESPSYLFLPRFYGLNKFGSPTKDKLSGGVGFQSDLKIVYGLLPHQQTAYDKGLKQLTESGGGILSVYCGFGKTFLGICFAIALGRKVLVVVNKECLMDQWIEAIAKFTGNQAKVGIIQQGRIDVKNKDFVVAMLHSLSLKDYPVEIFNDFGFTIIDEAHHVGSEMFSQALPKANARYILGLSATPHRKDGCDKVLEYYIGPIFHTEKRTGSNQVLVKRFKLTSDSPYYQTLHMATGTKNTSGMVTNLAKYDVRTQLIIECIQELMKEDRKILLLSGRREHLNDLHNRLKIAKIKNIHGKPITFGYYWGNQGKNKAEHKKMLEVSAKCDIVLGSINIASEGLDIPDINTEIMCTPWGDVQQGVGRILRKFHTINPIVIDFVDKLGNFPNQGRTRAKFYREEDYEIQDLDLHLTDNLDPHLNKIREYLHDTNLSQSKFKATPETNGDNNYNYNDDDDDDDNNKPKRQIKIGKCLLDKPKNCLI